MNATRVLVGVTIGLLVSAAVVRGAWADVVTTPGAAQPPPAVPVDPAIEKAAQAAREGRSDDAMALIREAAGKHPEWPPPRLILARMYFALNQAPQGRRAAEQAVVETPNDPRVYLMFVAIALPEGRLNDARLNCEKALATLEAAKLPDEPARVARTEAHAGLASAAEALDAWEEARTQLLAWLGDDPKNGGARQRLGRALFRLGKVDDAFKEITQAVKDNPKLEPAPVSMALLYGQTGKPAKAAEWFDYAAKVDPIDPRVRIAHARWLIDQGKAREARPLVEEAAKLDSASKEVEPLRGLIAWNLHEFATAERVYEGLHRDAPGDVTPANMLALALVEQDDSAKRARGLQLAEVTARQFPQSADAAATFGWAHYRSGHLEEASRLLRAAVSGGRASSDTAYFLARVLADQSQPDAARKLLTLAMSAPGAFAFRDEAQKLLTSLPASAAQPPAAKP